MYRWRANSQWCQQLFAAHLRRKEQKATVIVAPCSLRLFFFFFFLFKEATRSFGGVAWQRRLKRRQRAPRRGIRRPSTSRRQSRPFPSDRRRLAACSRSLTSAKNTRRSAGSGFSRRNLNKLRRQDVKNCCQSEGMKNKTMKKNPAYPVKHWLIFSSARVLICVHVLLDFADSEWIEVLKESEVLFYQSAPPTGQCTQRVCVNESGGTVAAANHTHSIWSSGRGCRKHNNVAASVGWIKYPAGILASSSSIID